MYINTLTMQYPVSENEIRFVFPNTSFGSIFIAPEPYEWVAPAPQPTYNQLTQGVKEITPVKVNGTWTQTYEVYALPTEQVAVNQAKEAERVLEEIVFNTQKYLDTFAKTRNYDGILSACTYATSAVPKFQQEGQYCVNARDQTWSAMYAVMAEVQAGTRPMPTGFADVVSELPVLAWPA